GLYRLDQALYSLSQQKTSIRNGKEEIEDFLTWLALSDVDIRSIQEFPEYKNLETTMISAPMWYANSTGERKSPLNF
ncbi:hypothetical protein, partial [Hydrogenimonas sp.]